MLCLFCIITSSQERELMFSSTCHTPRGSPHDPNMTLPQRSLSSEAQVKGPGRRVLGSLIFFDKKWFLTGSYLVLLSMTEGSDLPPLLLYFLEKNCGSTEGNIEAAKYMSANLFLRDNQCKHLAYFPPVCWSRPCQSCKSYCSYHFILLFI